MTKHPHLAHRWVVLSVAALVAIGAVVLVDPFSLLTDGEESEAVRAREQAEISLTALTGSIEADGELVATTTRTVATGAAGIVTDSVSVGDEIDASSVLFEIHGEPTLALLGDIPAWRTLSIGTIGGDVEQLELNLVALGYDPDAELTVDDTFTDYTAVVVERWQADLGLDATGSVALGAVEFVPDHSVVSSVLVGSGEPAAPGAPIVTTSSSDRQLHFVVEAQHLDAIEIGTEVSARLPDRTTLLAAVSEVYPTGDGTWAATATVGDGGDAVIPIGEALPVTVSWSEVVSGETTTVPAGALTRLDTGAYVLEVVDGDATRFVEVETGPSSGSIVAIVTDLPVGTRVVAP